MKKMLNIEKHKDEIVKYAREHNGNIDTSVRYVFNSYTKNREAKTEEVMNWMCEKVSLLTTDEFLFMETVIEYYDLVSVQKVSYKLGLTYKDGTEWFINKPDDMNFDGLEENRTYTIEELEL